MRPPLLLLWYHIKILDEDLILQALSKYPDVKYLEKHLRLMPIQEFGDYLSF